MAKSFSCKRENARATDDDGNEGLGLTWSKLLLQPKPFIDQPLQARPVENVVSEFFVGEHGESGAAGIGGHLGRFFQGQIGILAKHRHDHTHHYLQAAQSSGFLGVLIVLFAWLVGWLSFHGAPA